MEDTTLYALVELFGHQKVAGKLSEAEIGAGQLIRVDIPGDGNRAPLTKYYNVKAIYGITPVDEETCLRMASEINAAPIDTWSLEREVTRRLRPQIGTGNIDGQDEELF